MLVAIPAGGDTLAEIMSAADRAYYAAKDRGRNRVHVYAASDVELRQRQGEMQWIPAPAPGPGGRPFPSLCAAGRGIEDHGPEIEYGEVLLRLAYEYALLPRARRTCRAPRVGVASFGTPVLRATAASPALARDP
ncbi:MAG: hypothetical protein M3461_15925 [Pseudomonadota bacterium]|nr:hypothetical protein [Pseudomonadota bacterium]